MATKRSRANASLRLDDWFTVKKRSSRKSVVELDSEADGGDQETEGAAVATIISSNESGKPHIDSEESTTEVYLSNNAGSRTFQDCEMDIFISQENEFTDSISDLEDDLILSDQLSYSADKESSSNESSIAAGCTQANQTPIIEHQEAAGPSTISLLGNETPVAECQELCCSTSQSSPFQPHEAHFLHSLTTGGRRFMHNWYKIYPWLSICKTRKRAFCFYCKYATTHNMLTFSKRAEPTFSINGFNNWRKALQKFDTHQTSSSHREAILKWEAVQNAPISVQLTSQLNKVLACRRHCLLKQLSALRYLLRQGLAVRGHTENNGNLYQLLMLWSNEDKEMKQWITDSKYMSHEIITEQIVLMGQRLLRSLLQQIQQSSPAWYALMGDEATDVANKEQLNVSIRWVDDAYNIREDPVGLYHLPSTTADVIYTCIKDILVRCMIPLSLCRGQAYDGAANMQGHRKGVATQIKKECPSALAVHCFAHSLNLCLQDTGRKLVFLQDALEIVREIAKLIKFSPKRASLFSQVLAQPENSGVTIKPLCLT